MVYSKKKNIINRFLKFKLGHLGMKHRNKDTKLGNIITNQDAGVNKCLRLILQLNSRIDLKMHFHDRFPN